MSDCEFCAHFIIFQIAHECSGKCSCMMNLGSTSANCLPIVAYSSRRGSIGQDLPLKDKSEEKMPRKKQRRRTVHGDILSGSRGKIEKYGKTRV